MTPLLLFVLALVAAWLGTVDAAFSALIRLSLRLAVERSTRPAHLEPYLEAPMRLHVPLRVLLVADAAVSALLLERATRWDGPAGLVGGVALAVLLTTTSGVVLPMLWVRRDPEGVLRALLPSVRPVVALCQPLVDAIDIGAGSSADEPVAPRDASGTSAAGGEEPAAATAEDDRRLLQSIVDFAETLVREIMTPRPDIVALRDDATVAELRARYREQQYSRFPVYKDTLDNVVGFVFVKDLVALGPADDARPLSSLLRPAVIVPESQRVATLLAQLQRQQAHIAVVVDEYGGTAGLVTIEDMLEEIVGEIRDEYDEETDAIVVEPDGALVVHGRVDIDEAAQRVGVVIPSDGFETVGGFVLAHLGRVPVVGDVVDADGVRAEVLEVERRRVGRVRLTPWVAATTRERES